MHCARPTSLWTANAVNNQATQLEKHHEHRVHNLYDGISFYILYIPFSRFLCDIHVFSLHIIICIGVNPGGLGCHDPQISGWGRGVAGSRGPVVRYYCMLSCTVSMLEHGDF